jgi:hypothetical protein
MAEPEELARQEIDPLLEKCCWQVQDKASVNLHGQRGVAVRELSFKTGEPNCTLFVDGKAIGTYEIGKLLITFPCLAEWQRIVAEVECRLRVVEELESAVTANLRRATRLRRSILQRAFEGKLLRESPFSPGQDTR